MYDLLPYFVFLDDLILHMFTLWASFATKVLNMDGQLLCDSVLKQLFIYQISFCMNVSSYCMNFSCRLILKKTLPPLRKDLNSLGNSPKFSWFFFFNWTPLCKKSSVYNIDCRKTCRPVNLSFPKAKLSYCLFLPGYNLHKDRLQTVKLLPIVWGLYVVLHFTLTFNRFQASVIN